MYSARALLWTRKHSFRGRAAAVLASSSAAREKDRIVYGVVRRWIFFLAVLPRAGKSPFVRPAPILATLFFLVVWIRGLGSSLRRQKLDPVGEIVGVWVQHRQGQVRGNRKEKEGRGGRRFCQGDKGEMDCRLSVLGGVRKMGGKAANRGLRLSLGSEKGARLGPNSWHAICRAMGPSIGRRKVVPSFMRTVRYGDLHGGAVSPSSVGHCG